MSEDGAGDISVSKHYVSGNVYAFIYTVLDIAYHYIEISLCVCVFVCE